VWPSGRTLIFEPGSSPVETRANYRQFYNAVSEQLDSTEFGEFALFLNYGYVPGQDKEYAQVQLPDHFLNKNSVRLALELLGDCCLEGRRVLDVGCGRGGLVYVIRKFFNARYIIGIDLASAAISFCKKVNQCDIVGFLQAEAERLPFAAEAFDVVTNLESSHSYPDMAIFYHDVHRVLIDGGFFLYSDVLEMERWRDCGALLEAAGFAVELDRDITTNVLLSCDEIARARTQAFHRARAPELVDEFLGLPGSQVYEDMSKGVCRYKLLKLKKRESGRGRP
jgi:SAM-dependent methyltransferase